MKPEPLYSTSSRRERKAAAEDRRKAWRLRWLELARARHAEGTPLVECLRRVAQDADKLIADTPCMRSEVERAVDEFVTALAAATARAKEQAEPAQTPG